MIKPNLAGTGLLDTSLLQSNRPNSPTHKYYLFCICFIRPDFGTVCCCDAYLSSSRGRIHSQGRVNWDLQEPRHHGVICSWFKTNRGKVLMPSAKWEAVVSVRQASVARFCPHAPRAWNDSQLAFTMCIRPHKPISSWRDDCYNTKKSDFFFFLLKSHQSPSTTDQCCCYGYLQVNIPWSKIRMAVKLVWGIPMVLIDAYRPIRGLYLREGGYQ